MLDDRMLTGAASLPEGTLCLTFDDGPGETDGPGPGPRTRVGRGIVLLHGCSAEPGPKGAALRAGNRTLEAARLAVPALRAHGFSFAPLRDAVPVLP